MLAVNDDKKICIFSKGKTGTTTLQNKLTDWRTVGEAEVDWYGIGPAHFNFKSRQEDIVKYLDSKGYELIFIVREPWKRYVSGFKEVLQDYISGIATAEEFLTLWQKIVYDEKRLVAFIDRLFYLTQFICDGKQEQKHNWGRAFTLHTNYHTCNYLDFCEQFKGSYVDSNYLDDFMKRLHLDPGERANTSLVKDIQCIESALKKCNHYYLIEKFLEPEIKRYEHLVYTNKIPKPDK